VPVYVDPVTITAAGFQRPVAAGSPLSRFALASLLSNCAMMRAFNAPEMRKSTEAIMDAWVTDGFFFRECALGPSPGRREGCGPIRGRVGSEPGCSSWDMAAGHRFWPLFRPCQVGSVSSRGFRVRARSFLTSLADARAPYLVAREIRYGVLGTIRNCLAAYNILQFSAPHSPADGIGE
jgi:hypothetical protein